MKEKGKWVYFPCYLPFHHFFAILFTVSVTLISRVFHSALTKNYSLSSKPHAFSPAFSASPLSEGETQDPRSGHYSCENIRSLFLPLTAHVCSVPLTRERSPQSQPQAMSPEHSGTLDLRAVSIQLCSSFPESHFSDMNSQGCFVVQLLAQLPRFETPLHYS